MNNSFISGQMAGVETEKRDIPVKTQTHRIAAPLEPSTIDTSRYFGNERRRTTTPSPISGMRVIGDGDIFGLVANASEAFRIMVPASRITEAEWAYLLSMRSKVDDEKHAKVDRNHICLECHPDWFYHAACSQCGSLLTQCKHRPKAITMDALEWQAFFKEYPGACGRAYSDKGVPRICSLPAHSGPDHGQVGSTQEVAPHAANDDIPDTADAVA